MSDRESMELGVAHLILSEINAVTSAIRKHVRNSSSSSFLGGSSTTNYGPSGVGVGGPVAGGSSAASLLRSAVQAAAASSSSSSGPPPPAATSNGIHFRPPRIAGGARGISTNAAAGAGESSKGRRDDGVAGLLNGFTVLRAQLRESPSERESNLA